MHHFQRNVKDALLHFFLACAAPNFNDFNPIFTAAQRLWESLLDYTANILGAKIAALSCVTRPAAVWMYFMQFLGAAIFRCRFCSF